MYDLMDVHKNEPHKYLIMQKETKGVEAKDFSLQNKMFRKFFYENSSPIDDLMTFVEIENNSKLAAKLGFT